MSTWRAPSHGALALGLFRGAVLVVRFAPGGALVFTAVAVAAGLSLPIVAALTGEAIDVVPALVAGQSDWSRLLGPVVGIAVALTAFNVAAPVQSIVQQRVAGLVRRGLAGQVMAANLALPGLHHFEDPDSQDRLLHVSNWTSYGPRVLLQLPSSMAQAALSLVGFMGVLASAGGWWLSVAVVASGVPRHLWTGRYMAGESSAAFAASVDARRLTYHSGLLSSSEAAKEVRLFGLKDWLLERRRRYWLATLEGVWASRRRGIAAGLGLGLVPLAVITGALLYMLAGTLRGQFSVGSFAAAALALTGLGDATAVLLQNYGFVRRDLALLPTTLAIRSLHRDDPRMAMSSSPVAPPAAWREIRFDGVHFSYPSTGKVVVDRLDLTIRAGQSLALVGLNGSGKTTIVKLLCRFYDPTEGRILVDGIDLRELDLVGWRHRLAVIFQDFQRYGLPVRDNIGFGAPRAIGDADMLRRAASAVGTDARIDSLPQGWDTVLRPDMGGVDLSGGEWQRVALARMMAARYGSGSDLLVLDEPTANLDVRIEHELYQRFADLTHGATALLISHRFSTVRMADRIVVLDAGRITEDGSHAELLGAGGRYATLYEEQASAFRSSEWGDGA